MATLRDTIITSKSADRMLRRVSPIYDNSYVGLWMFEAIGREYDKLWEIVDTLPDQMFPETTTWAIELWEKRYGIIPAPGLSLEERRRNLASRRVSPRPFIPALLEWYILTQTGRTSEVADNIRAYTFGVYITSDGGLNNVETSQIRTYINRNKPSHLSYDLAFQALSTIGIAVETAYWRFPYQMTGNLKAGEHPQHNIVFGAGSASICVSPETAAYLHPYDLTGTKPETNTLAALSDAGFDVEAAARGYMAAYPMADGHEAGRIPEPSTGAGLADGGITARADFTGYAYPYPLTGTDPDISTASAAETSPIRASPEGTAYSIAYRMCGTTNSGQS